MVNTSLGLPSPPYHTRQAFSLTIFCGRLAADAFGEGFALSASGTTNDLLGVSCTDANTCTAVGVLNGTILRTNTGGQ